MQRQGLSQFSEIHLLHSAVRKLSPLILFHQFPMGFSLLKWWPEFRSDAIWCNCNNKSTCVEKNPLHLQKTNWKKSVSAAWLWIVYNMAICKICRILYQADHLNIFHLWKGDYMISHAFSPSWLRTRIKNKVLGLTIALSSFKEIILQF